MTKAKKQGGMGSSKPLTVQANEGETEAATMARIIVDPFLRHGIVGSALSDKMVGKLPGEPRFDDFSTAIRAKTKGIREGHKALAIELLTAQALSLDTLFTELSRRATMNMGEYPQTAERYGRLALKAQSNCRSALEALAKIYQPREQTVRHVHVNEGGNAIVADEFHQHAGGQKMKKSTHNPMQPERLASAPRCLARTRSGTECQSPAVTGRRRCRMHGGTNPGAPRGNRNAWRHGGRSAETMAAARWLNAIARIAREEGD